MKTIVTILFAGLTVAAAAPAYADQPGADWMPMDQAMRKLTDAGYRDLRNLEAENGRWEATATKDGKTVGVRVDPRSGEVAVGTEAEREAQADADGD